MRILITGSRDWQDRDAIYNLLNRLVPLHATIVHGDCPTGADALAQKWAESQPDIKVERYPADWNQYGKSAGPRRNQQMVDLGADICIAFPLSTSRGTRDCMRKAKTAGIPVLVLET